MRYIYTTFVIFLISGCAPNFYTSDYAILTNRDIQIVDTNINRKCIFEKEIPHHYKLERKHYSMYFRASALQIGLKINGSSIKDLAVESPFLKPNNASISNIGKEYTHIFSVKDSGTISINIMSKDEIIAVENIRYIKESCKAIVIDGM